MVTISNKVNLDGSNRKKLRGVKYTLHTCQEPLFLDPRPWEMVLRRLFSFLLFVCLEGEELFLFSLAEQPEEQKRLKRERFHFYIISTILKVAERKRISPHAESTRGRFKILASH
jgi:hypothetical protein